MIEKNILHKVLSHIKNGALTVTYWDGVTRTYGHDEPSLHITIKTIKAARAVLAKMSVGFGESYMNGDIDIDGPIDQIMKLITDNKPAISRQLKVFRQLRDGNVRERQKSQIQHHYDLGNDFYKMWLDETMTYSCAYFHKPSDTIDEAQQQKVAHILRKLQLKAGQTLLDIGSGWGTLLITAAKEYGISGHGITLSEEQWKHSTAAAKKAGVSKQVKFELIGYQDLAERAESKHYYDRIVSVGMFEHVGLNNQADYFVAVSHMLKPQGISVLHTISHEREMPVNPWINKYIFPGGYIPAIRQVVRALPEHDFHLIDYENLRIHYAMTLDQWLQRFEAHKSKVLAMYDETFYRMWKFYLATSSGSFRYGDLSLSQFVFTKGLNNDLPLTRAFLYKK